MADIDEATGVPESARVESWLRTLIGFKDARVVTVAALTDGQSNVTCRVKLTDAPAAAVLRIQPTRGIFEPNNILPETRENELAPLGQALVRAVQGPLVQNRMRFAG